MEVLLAPRTLAQEAPDAGDRRAPAAAPGRRNHTQFDTMDSKRIFLSGFGLLSLGALASAQVPVARDLIQIDAGVAGAPSAPSVDGDGSLVAAGYFDGGSSGTQFVSVVRSTDGGLTWGAPVRADTDLGGASKLMNRDSVKVAGNNVYALWRDTRNSNLTDDLFFNYSTDGGATFQAADVQLDDGAAGANEVFDWRFAVVPDATGDDLYVLFTAEIVGGNANEEVFLVSSLDGGVTWGTAVKVGGDDAGSEDVDQIALAVDGTTVHMAFEFDFGTGSFDDVLYQRTDDAGATLLPAAVQLDEGGSGDSASSSDTGLAIAASGSLVVCAWPEELTDPSNEELRLNVSVDGGATWGTDQQIGGYDASLNDIDALALAIADGNIAVVWDDNRSALGFDELYAAVSTDAGATFTETLISGPLGGSVPRLAAEDDNLSIAYTSEDGADDYAAAVVSADAGVTWSTELMLTDNASGADSDSTDGGLAAGAENFFVVTLNDALGSNNVYVTGFSLCDDGASVVRNAGSNPASLTADVPQLGGTWNASVDLGLTGHGFAGLVGFASPANIPLPGGQVLLTNALDPGGELFGLPLAGGSPATFSLVVPNDPALCGTSLTAQAVHVTAVTPFALSNAVDLVVGAL